MYKRTFSKTHRARIAQAKRGTTHSEETKRKISASIKKKWQEAPSVVATDGATHPTHPTPDK